MNKKIESIWTAFFSIKILLISSIEKEFFPISILTNSSFFVVLICYLIPIVSFSYFPLVKKGYKVLFVQMFSDIILLFFLGSEIIEIFIYNNHEKNRLIYFCLFLCLTIFISLSIKLFSINREGYKNERTYLM